MSKFYEQNKFGFDRLAADGFPAIGEMAKHFDNEQNMCAALDFSHGTVHAWLRGGGIKPSSYRRAQSWVDANGRQAKSAPVTSPAAGQLYLVTCPPGADDKLRKVLMLFGCEVVDI